MNNVIRVLRIVMPVVGLISAIVFPPWNGILAWLAPLPETVQEQVDDAIDRGLDGIIVCIDRGDGSPSLYSSGLMDRSNRTPTDPNALFKIGSISKLYIAAATAKLVAGGQLSLDDTLADHLPRVLGTIDHADRITLRMMLQHRSGIPNYTDHTSFDWSAPPRGLDEVLNLVRDMPSDFEPDSDHRYSNTNFSLIGRILDDVLGYDHQRYIDEQILTPLGLDRTFGSLSLVDPDLVISGYHHPHEIDFKYVDFVNPGGSYIATARDTGIFLRALNAGSLLSEAEQAVYSSVYEYGHKGWVLGYQSIARYHEEIDTVVVQFVNTTGDESELTTTVVYDRIVKIIANRTP